MVHDYLGITLDYSQEGTVKVTMIDYIKQMLVDLLDDMNGIAATLAADHLFQMNLELVLLSPDKAELFHHNMAKLLVLCKQA